MFGSGKNFGKNLRINTRAKKKRHVTCGDSLEILQVKSHSIK